MKSPTGRQLGGSAGQPEAGWFIDPGPRSCPRWSRKCCSQVESSWWACSVLWLRLVEDALQDCSLRGAAAGILPVTALPQQSCSLPSVFSGLLWLVMLINDFAALHHLLAGLQARSTHGQAAQSFRNYS